MNEPTKSQQFSLVELVACLFGMIAMIWLLRWSWQRFDGVGLVVALLSPFIGLLCGGILILVLAWSVAACRHTATQ